MSDLDEMLMRLGAEPVPEALAGLDQVVFVGVGKRRERQLSRRTLALAGGVAIFVGIGSAVAPAGTPNAEPLLGMPDAAPSRLLAG